MNIFKIRKYKYLVVSLLIIGIFTFFTGCDTATESTKSMTVFVTVEDSNGTAVDGVELTLTDEDGTTHEETTGDEGKASFSDVKLLENNKYTISASKDGYDNKDEKFTAEDEAQVTIEMTSATVTVSTASELETALGDRDVEVIKLSGNISGNFTTLRSVDIEGGDYELTGDITVGDDSVDVKTILSDLDLNGGLTADAGDGTVSMKDVSAKNVAVDSVGDDGFGIEGKSSVDNMTVNADNAKITGGRKVIRAVVNGSGVVFDRPPQEVDEEESENTPEYEDASRFTVVSIEEKEIDTSFALNIKSAFDKDNNKLDGEYSVSVESDVSGSVHSGLVSFTEGEASVDLTLGETGEHELTVEIGEVTGSETAKVSVVYPTSKQPSRLKVTTQPSETRAGNELSVAVKALDEYDRAVKGVPISVGLNMGDFEEGTTTVTTNENGVATFDDLVITTAREGYELTFSSSEVDSVTGDEFKIKPGFASAENSSFAFGEGVIVPAQRVSINKEQESSEVSGTVIAGKPGEIVFSLKDDYGNPVREGRRVSLSNLAPGEYNVGSTGDSLIGEFALNKDMSNSVSDISSLKAKTNSKGKVKVYFRTEQAPTEDEKIKSEVSVQSNTMPENIGRLGAAIDGVNVTSTNLAVAPGLPDSMEVVEQPTDTPQGGIIEDPYPELKVVDEYGNPVLDGFQVVGYLDEHDIGDTFVIPGGRAIFTDNTGSQLTIPADTTLGSHKLKFELGYQIITPDSVNSFEKEEYETMASSLLKTLYGTEALESLSLTATSDPFSVQEKLLVPVTITGYTGEETDIVIPSEIDDGMDSNFEFEESLGSDEIGVVTSIKEWSLSANSLTSVIIPDSVISIGVGAFYGLTEENIALGSGYLTYFVYSEDGKTLEGHIGTPNTDLDLTMLPADVNTIGFNVFNGCELSTVSFGSDSNIETIEGSAFHNNNLTSLIIPNSVNTIGDSAFSSNQLTSVTISTNATSIGLRAFKDNQITSVSIPASITSIGEYAFENNNLEGLIFEGTSSLETIGKNAFSNAFDISKDTSVIIPDSVTIIEQNAFYQNSIDTLTLGNSVATIGHSAFFENSIKSLTIPDSVTDIEGNAFYGNSISSLIIPSSVGSIGGSAFHSNSLTSITIPDDATVGVTAFMSNLLTTITIGESVTLEANLLGSDEFKNAYESGGAGTYTGNQTEDPQDWTKE